MPRVYRSRMTTTPPGWYDDGHGAMRWWDGARWTEHVAAPDPVLAEPASDPHALATDAATLHDPAPAPGPATPVSPVEAYPDAGGAPAVATATPPAPAAPPAPAKSKLWIVWVVLGVVVLGILILGAVLLSRILAAGIGQVGLSGDGGPADADQQAAVAAVELYDDAWQDADCDAYMASTTEGFRTESGLTDCSTFESEAEAFGSAVEDYEVEVTDVRQEEDAIVVTTTETYTALVDDNGEPLDEPTDDSIDWVYTVVADGDDWLIDDMQ